MDSETVDASSSQTASTTTTETLPSLTDYEERKYGALAVKMQYFHDMLQREYEAAYKMADGSFNKAGMSLRQYLRFVDDFRGRKLPSSAQNLRTPCTNGGFTDLTMHHDIEEAHVFPKLAKKMPEFRANERHKKSHKLIHNGLDRIEAAVKGFEEDNSSYNPVEMRAALDSFREPLYTHLAEEVRDLGAENMRKYWTLSEIAAFRF
ncbi:hypothetical protein FRC17_006421 [Serendipita sp. 399]|nr:hypothetical protein FRC17_006421 [Serendipita sp. 399]